MNVYAPIKGKCVWWREFPNEEDRWDTGLRLEHKRVECICFVEGDMWEYRRSELPQDCPVARKCRYHVRAG